MATRCAGNGSWTLADARARRWSRVIVAALYLITGIVHIAAPRGFLRITPPWVPFAPQVIFLTGIAEVAGALGLIQSISHDLRKAAGWGLALYAVCVLPANINHMMMDLAANKGLGWVYHGPRMLLQPVLVWLALWTGHVIEWPFAAARR
ncbi:MAG: DoxX family protein [Sphingobium sp.]|nr:DoxX family protein [Sphingobium sp.]MBP6112731.1 DoxX family protein [Sphingobium sp.]MBP8670773.1 DoxX family protein [Sphingobium sp.]MBP9157753.1 DoxX family protein [Sphingobium sp.]MCC6480814.1 DoxX family protein [Sphingomonadaceae bacterium]